MRDSIKVSGTVAVANPRAFLIGRLKAGIIALTLGTQRVNGFELYSIPVNGKPVIIGNGDIFGAT